MRQYIRVFFFTERVLILTISGATIQVANLVNYNCHPQEGMAIRRSSHDCLSLNAYFQPMNLTQWVGVMVRIKIKGLTLNNHCISFNTMYTEVKK